MNHTQPVTAVTTANVIDGGVPGAFEIVEDQWLQFICSCGCGRFFRLPLFKPHGWTWDGNRERPTITPSIRQLNGCKWHGHLRAGVWQPEGDSGK